MDYLIKNIDSLKMLRNEKNLKHSIRKIKLDVDDNIFSQLHERKLNKYYFACGCQEGAIGVYLSLICCFIVWWISDFAAITNWWKIVIIIAVSALIGKLLGLLINRIRLKRIFHDLEAYFNDNTVK